MGHVEEETLINTQCLGCVHWSLTSSSSIIALNRY